MAGQVIGAIGLGLVVLVGVSSQDGPADVKYVADKVSGLRIFPDDQGKMNRSINEAGGSALVVSQFTLYADARKGRRPSFTDAALPEIAEPLIERFADMLHQAGIERVEMGVFGALMQVEIHNDGPVTILLDTDARG